MEYRILGPLEVVDGAGRRVDLGGPKQRALLAGLLLHPNEVVSHDALVDALWGERPPATATKTLQAYVSRLRKALESDDAAGEAVLETRGRGYLLHVATGALDADEFERLVEEGRRALARGDPKQAAESLHTALALWRGPALADLRYELFAQADVGRLEEQRLAALEDRIEADLALGRDAELVPELEALVERHPLRERLRGQLMLALYRADRQAQALEVFQRGRQLLAEELGLQPGEALRELERQILDQDPALTATRRRERPAIVPEPVWRHPRRVLAAGAALVAIAVGLAVVQLTRDTTGVDDTAGAVVLDPETGTLDDRVPLGTAPSSVAIGEGHVWVLDGDDKTVSRIDPETHRVERVFSTSSTPTDIAVGAGAIWVGNAPAGGLGDFPVSVSHIDPESLAVVETIELPRSPGGHAYNVVVGFSRQKLAASGDAVWAVNSDQTVSRIDPRTNRLVARIEARADSVAVGEGDVWIAEAGRIAEIDPGTNTVGRRVVVAEDGIAALAVGAGAVWVADPLGGSIWRVDRDPPFQTRRIPVERWVNGIAFGEGAVWATNEIADEVMRIDPRTSEARVVARTVSPRAVGAGQGAVWVAAARSPTRDAELPSSACSEVFFGGTGEPRVLLVSDLPLKGSSRATTVAIVAGVRYALAHRGFEAGGYSVGYQSCDSSSAQTGGSDFFRCGSNAKAFAQNLSVIGVIGSYATYCSYLQLPIVNRAPGGPIAMISPSNTGLELWNEELYPTGIRNFVRIAAADHLQAVGHVALTKQLRAERLVVLSPRGDDYFAIFARNVTRAARQLGLHVTNVVFDRDAANFSSVVRKVVRARPEAIAIEDVLQPGPDRLIRSLRAALGAGVTIMVPDGFALFDDLVKVLGPSAEGLYVTQYGIPNSKLPPRGKQFLESFAAAQGGEAGPDFGAAYGAQAAEILLDAIARSDGTRASVTRELFETRVEGGILGDIRFDRKGDLVTGPIAVYRIARGRPVVDRVVVARSELVRSAE